MLGIKNWLNRTLHHATPQAPVAKPPVVAAPAADDFDRPDPAVGQLDKGLAAATAASSDGGAVITKAEVDPLLRMVQPIIFSPLNHDPDRARIDAVLGKYGVQMSEDASRSVSWFRLASDE
jgi:hypothetical protein